MTDTHGYSTFEMGFGKFFGVDLRRRPNSLCDRRHNSRRVQLQPKIEHRLQVALELQVRLTNDTLSRASINPLTSISNAMTASVR
jgi:hypothetical protein